ncbi:DUF3037 domain-containing protein [Vibrio cionasavignyae]|uniref:DUF3037 domain-containing protein n=1 Tax=Vibrio cionasavignyae TaxID=2910252 RepID=UPI003D108737
MKVAVHYSIIRFMPFSETQEFANVGVLAFVPKTGYVNFKIAPKRFKRVSDFFEDIEGNLYKQAISTFEEELHSVQQFARRLKGQDLVNMMLEITREREGLMTFADPGIMISENPDAALTELFEVYIGRNFKEVKEYREQQMVKALRRELTTAIDIKYQEKRLDAGYGFFKLPLVTVDNNDIKAIKPLAFDQHTPLMLADHGERWISRIKHLIRAKTIKHENFLFALEKPTRNTDEFQTAYEVVTQEMKELGVQIQDFENRNSIFTFAKPNWHSPDDFELIS